jgi:hypothetical protein
LNTDFLRWREQLDQKACHLVPVFTAGSVCLACSISDSINQMTEALRGWFILALLVFLAGLVLWVLILFLREMVESKQNLRPGVWIEANWGGLGGGLSGWRVSNAIIYLLVMSLLLGCLSLAVVSLSPAVEKKTQPAQKTDAAKKDEGMKAGGTKGAAAKPGDAETPDSAANDKDLKKSSNAPAVNKAAE